MSSMLKKGTGAFKPKAVARRRPAPSKAPSQDEESLTTESQTSASEATTKESTPTVPQTDKAAPRIAHESKPERPIPPTAAAVSSTTGTNPAPNKTVAVPAVPVVPRPSRNLEALKHIESSKDTPHERVVSTITAKSTAPPVVDDVPPIELQQSLFPSTGTLADKESVSPQVAPAPAAASDTPYIATTTTAPEATALQGTAEPKSTKALIAKPVAVTKTTAPVPLSHTLLEIRPTPPQADMPIPTIESNGQIVRAGKTPAPKKPRNRKAAAAMGKGEVGQDGTPGEGSVPPKKKRAPRKKKPPGAEGEEGGENGEHGESSAKPKKKRAPRKKPAVADVDNGEVDDAEAGAADHEGEGEGEDNEAIEPKKKRRKRSVTPEGAEKETVDTATTTMAELTKDMRLGHKFSRLDELRTRHRQKRARMRLIKLGRLKEGEEMPGPQDAEDAEEADDDTQAGTLVPGTEATPPAPEPAPADEEEAEEDGPRVRVVDGNIIIDEESLAYDPRKAATANISNMEEIVEDDFSQPITSSTYMKAHKRGPNFWTDEETVKFYQMLRMFGTDFNMIAKTFGGTKTRRHVKLKFNREESHNPEGINKCLIGDKTIKMDMEVIKNYTGEEYEETNAIEAELAKQKADQEAEQKKIEDEIAAEARRKREELFGKRNGDDADDSGEEDAVNRPDKPHNLSKQKKRKQSETVQKDGEDEVIDETDLPAPKGKGRGGKKKAVSMASFFT